MKTTGNSVAAKASPAHFLTPAGEDVPAVTSEQMREVDRIAMEETGPNLYQMMENAGRNLALLAIELLGENWQKASVVVLAGSGGNGGGGICAARYLANRNVTVLLCLSDLDHLAEVPAWQRQIFQSAFGRETSPAQLAEQRPDLILDALIGYGLGSAPRGTVAELIGWANSADAPVLSLDVPSGVDATTGEAPGIFIRSRWTMTLALPKTGLMPEKTGDLFLADIGIPEGTYRRMNLPYKSPFGARFWIPIRCR